MGIECWYRERSSECDLVEADDTDSRKLAYRAEDRGGKECQATARLTSGQTYNTSKLCCLHRKI
jgi:hypothetical protein